jgi:mRNA interferase MazF
MKKGDIVLIPFPFTDLSGNKNRPAVVLSGNKYDIIVAFVSTNLNWSDETDIALKANPENGLKKDSLIKLSKIATLEKSLILGLLGNIDANTMDAINQNLLRIFSL